MNYKNMRFGVFAVIFSTCGVVVLYLLSALSNPVKIDLKDLHRYEGREVIVEGRVIEKYITKTDCLVLRIRENNYTATIFIGSFSGNIEIGDEIQAIGKVQRYREEYEVVVINEKDLKVLKHWRSEFMRLSDVATMPEKYLDTNVNLLCYIKSVYRSENETTIYVTDDISNENHSLKVTIKRDIDLSLHRFDYINVRGRFVYDEYTLRYQIVVEDEEHSIKRI